MEINQNKDLRNIHKQLRNDMSATEHKLKSADIVKNTLALLESDFKGANIFLCYYPYNSEVDLLPLYESLLARGKSLFFQFQILKITDYYFIKYRIYVVILKRAHMVYLSLLINQNYLISKIR